MKNSTVPAVALLLAACAANSPREDLGYEPAALGQSAALAATAMNEVPERVVPTQLGPATEVVASPSDAQTGIICEVRERPGSRVKQKICATQEAYSATREAAQDQLTDMQRELQRLEEITREAEINARRFDGFGPGP